MLLAALAGLAGAFPYTTLPWSQYAAATPWEPYNNLIAYANQKNALVFWAHPEARNWVEPQHLRGPVFAQTTPYPDCLQKAPGADGFAVFMEGYKRMARPGGEWDEALLDYIRGRRAKPAWAFAELDLTSLADTAIDSSYMLVEAQARTAEAVLAALKHGHFQAVSNSSSGTIEIRDFRVAGRGGAARQGESAPCGGGRAVSALIEGARGARSADIQLVKNGAVVLSGRRALPAEITFQDDAGAEQPAYYRLTAQEVNSMAYSNPAFCVGGGK
jgi:hypothetical protein